MFLGRHFLPENKCCNTRGRQKQTRTLHIPTDVGMCMVPRSRNARGACSHYLRPSADLIDFAWGARQMHCRPFRPLGPLACVKKLRNFVLWKRRIRRPIRSWICKYTPRVSWIHFAITSRENLVTKSFSHLLFVSSFVFISTHRLCSRKRFD